MAQGWAHSSWNEKCESPIVHQPWNLAELLIILHAEPPSNLLCSANVLKLLHVLLDKADQILTCMALSYELQSVCAAIHAPSPTPQPPLQERMSWSCVVQYLKRPPTPSFPRVFPVALYMTDSCLSRLMPRTESTPSGSIGIVLRVIEFLDKAVYIRGKWTRFTRGRGGRWGGKYRKSPACLQTAEEQTRGENPFQSTFLFPDLDQETCRLGTCFGCDFLVRRAKCPMSGRQAAEALFPCAPRQGNPRQKKSWSDLIGKN